jgi:hypothetical protein
MQEISERDENPQLFESFSEFFEKNIMATHMNLNDLQALHVGRSNSVLPNASGINNYLDEAGLGITSQFSGDFSNNRLDENPNQYSKDFLIYKTTQAETGPKVLTFDNPVGKIQNQLRYQDAIGKLLSDEQIELVEEHWVETVFEFSGDASILAGLYGSNTIGETFDRGALQYEPTLNVVNKFSTNLIDNIILYSAEGEATQDVANLDSTEAMPGPTHYSFGRPYHSTLWIQN